MKKKVIKAWAVIEDNKLIPYTFSYDGERTYMTFPTRNDAVIFRGATKSWEIIKVEIHLSKPSPSKRTKKK